MNKYIRSFVSWLYLFYNSELKLSKSERKTLLDQAREFSESSEVKVAFICDEMTWCDYSDYCKSIFLHPQTCIQQLEEFKPDILFCESAWCGIDRYLNCWRGKIYKDTRINFENRKELFDIVEYCKSHQIKTVFWNKEDPVFFEHLYYNFSDTAKLFDFVFTTAEECIENYYKLGIKNVFLLPFSANTSLFNTSKRNTVANSVVFTGSWFSDQPQRCEDLEQLLDYAIDQKWKLDIYDRKSHSCNSKFQYPNKYKKYIHSAVPYSKIPEIYQKYEYAINVNTVTKSKTMCSRRLLQMLSSGLKVISNPTESITRLEDSISYHVKSEDIFIIQGDFESINRNHSCKAQIDYLINCISGEKSSDLDYKGII